MIATLFDEPARIAFLCTTPDGLRRLPTEAPGIVARCQELLTQLRDHWNAIQKMGEESAWPVPRLEPYFTLVFSLADVYLDSIELLRESIDDAGDKAIDGAALSDVEKAVRSIRAEASAEWEFLTAPLPPRQLPTTAEILEELENGEAMDIEDVIAQLTTELDEAP